MCIGKRPVVLVSMLLFLGGLVWSFEAPTIHSLLGARIVASFGAGSIEAIGPSIIADLFMERYFSTAMAIFALFLSGGSQVGPIIAGSIVADRGWRWFFKVCTILNGVNLFFCIFFLPETTWRRPYVHDGETAAEVDKEAEIAEHHEKGESGQKMTTSAESEGYGQQNVYAGSYWKDLVAFKDRGQEETGLKAFPRQFLLPFRFLLVPAAIYATIAYGVMLAG